MSLLANEISLRLISFAAVFVLMAFAEWMMPRRRLQIDRRSRWFGNLSLAMVNSIAVRVLMPISAVGMAIIVEERDWGVLRHLSVTPWLGWVGSIIFLDLTIYLQHLVFHASPSLWKLHKVHHADVDFDLTTGVRFHTLEILISMLIKLSVVVAVGIPASAVLAFELLLNATAMFNHGNIRLPIKLDRILRWILVTPDMHRVHHSIVARECGSNFGFNLPWWDHLFGTYRDQPKLGHESMSIGLAEVRDDRAQHLQGMLMMPFEANAAGTIQHSELTLR